MRAPGYSVGQYPARDDRMAQSIRGKILDRAGVWCPDFNAVVFEMLLLAHQAIVAKLSARCKSEKNRLPRRWPRTPELQGYLRYRGVRFVRRPLGLSPSRLGEGIEGHGEDDDHPDDDLLDVG